MLKTVKLYGDLADFVGWKEQKADVRDIKQTMKFLVCNHPELESYMKNKHYKVIINNNIIKNNNDFLIPIKEEIKIIPVVEGELFGILAGLLFTGFATEIATFIGIKAFASIATNLGIGLILNDVTNYLTPKPKPMSSLEPEDATVNFAFSGVTNVSRAGVALPLVYGEIFVGSINVSNGIDTDQIVGSV